MLPPTSLTVPKKLEDLGDQVVPNAEAGTEHPVIVHNRLEEWLHAPSDAPLFRYRGNHKNGNREISQTNSNVIENNLIVLD